MDSFIDKFAQRKKAQDMIKANVAAENGEMERLLTQVADYEKAIEEIRKSNFQNIENAEKLRALLEEGLKKIDEVQKTEPQETLKLDDVKATVHRELTEIMGEATVAEQLQSTLAKELPIQLQESLSKELPVRLQEELGKSTSSNDELKNEIEDYVHRENVKVYRNVQAVVQEELTKQSEQQKIDLHDAVETVEVPAALLPIGVITLILVIGDIALQVLRIFGIL
ncbi:MAG: hypothetical protein K6G23_00850 [Lachnospiraceae bacterium]|nr:hypothetical protein [Lachnospiraceae bacterium]